MGRLHRHSANLCHTTDRLERLRGLGRSSDLLPQAALPPRVAALPARTNRSCHPSCHCLRACCDIFARKRGVMWSDRAGRHPLVKGRTGGGSWCLVSFPTAPGCGSCCSLTLKSRFLHKRSNTLTAPSNKSINHNKAACVRRHPGPSALPPPAQPAAGGAARGRHAQCRV